MAVTADLERARQASIYTTISFAKPDNAPLVRGLHASADNALRQATPARTKARPTKIAASVHWNLQKRVEDW